MLLFLYSYIYLFVYSHRFLFFYLFICLFFHAKILFMYTFIYIVNKTPVFKIYIYISKHPPPKRTNPTNIHHTKKQKRTFHRKQPTVPMTPEEPSSKPFWQCPPPPACQNKPFQQPKSPQKPSFLPLTVFNNRLLPPNSQPASSEHPKQAQRGKGKPPQKKPSHTLFFHLFIYLHV